MWNGGSWISYMRSGDQKPKVTRELLLRVLTYARPYWNQIGGMLVMILLSTGVSLISPLIFRNMIDQVLPQKDMGRLLILAIALLLLPIFNGLLGVVQRRLNAAVGEGVIYDLRVALFARLQRMSLRFFTNTKSGELMSRLNNDVVGAQNAISNTIVNIITNIVEAVAILVGHDRFAVEVVARNDLQRFRFLSSAGLARRAEELHAAERLDFGRPRTSGRPMPRRARPARRAGNYGAMNPS